MTKLKKMSKLLEKGAKNNNNLKVSLEKLPTAKKKAHEIMLIIEKLILYLKQMANSQSIIK